MPSFTIVENFNPVKDRYVCLLPGGEGRPVDELSFETGEETLSRSVVPAVAFSAHAALDTGFFQSGLIFMTCILTASVRVAQQPGLWFTGGESSI